MTSAILIPVRLNSERLPKKALKKINGKPMIQHLIERLKKVKNIDSIIICTTTDPSDDELVEFLEKNNFNFFRGSTKDILDRFLKTAEKFKIDFIIAVDGDDIYSEPKHIKIILNEFQKNNSDCLTISGVPVGFTPIGFKTSILKKICSLKNTDNTETGYIRFFLNKKLFDILEIKIKTNKSFSEDLRMSLDYDLDFKIAKQIFKKFGNNFDIEDILNFLSENPKILDELNELQKKWTHHWNKNLSDTSTRNM